MLGKTLTAAAALTLLATAHADANCTQANAGGSWAAYAAGTVDGTYFWFRCTVAISAAGKITAGTCVQSDGQSTPVTGSLRLTVPADCRFNGTIDITKFKETSTINQATMSLDKQTVLGVGALPGQKFTFNMLKVK